MPNVSNTPQGQAAPAPLVRGFPRLLLSLGFGVTGMSLLAALILPKGFALAAFGDVLEVGLAAAATFLAFQNFLHSHSRVRVFWFLVSAGAFLWTISNGTWAVYEICLARPLPDVPIVDLILFVMVVPLTGALLVAPDQEQEPQFRAFGLLDVFALMIFSLYLFAFGVFAYRLLPEANAIYNFYFNLADAIGNQLLLVVAGIVFVRSQGSWRNLFRLYFLFAACAGLASNLSNVAIDAGRYYTGSLYDVPLVASLAALVCVAIAGRTLGAGPAPEQASKPSNLPPYTTIFPAEHLAMLAALSTPLIGIWLLSSPSAPPQLLPFRLAVTLAAIFALTLLLSIKEDLLSTGLFQSLQRLSETHNSIERFKMHLTQSEKLATLGGLVAQAANQIRTCMAATLQASSRLASRPDSDSRILIMAGKIGQYAQRTDLLVDNMLHFAQETPLSMAPLEVKPLLESALHLSRVAKLPQVSVELTHEGGCPPVRGDSSQLLHVFLQLISNAIDALQDVGGGTLQIKCRPSGDHLLMEFADSGPGLKEPRRVFEPFYTTKPVGKGTGLGLSTCYGIIQQHEGEILCRNRPEGGAVFTLLLPFALERASRKSDKAGALLAESAQ